MKKHKIIGLAILLVAIFGVAGFSWYKGYVYTGVNEVSAAENPKWKYDEKNECKNDGVALTKKNSTTGSSSYEISSPNYAYTVNVYTYDRQSNPAVEALEAARVGSEVRLDRYIQPIASVTKKAGEKYKFSFNDVSLTGSNNIIVLEVVWANPEDFNPDTDRDTKKGHACVRHESEVHDDGEYGVPTSVKSNICNRWRNGEAIGFKNGGKDYTLNSDTFAGDDAKQNAFNEYKTKYFEAGKPCGSGYNFDGDENLFMFNLYLYEKSFSSYYRVLTSSNKGSNDSGLGDKSQYEEVGKNANGEIEVNTLYCKTNSVYLSDVSDGENKLESPAGNGSAISYADREKARVDGKKANLYLFKHTESIKKTYTVYSGEEEPKTEEACEIECVEYLKVNFDPPQQVKAGMCFSYAVQVIAYTECENKTVAPAPTPEIPSSVRTVCEEPGQWISDGAGPDDDFDSCVLSCDGGKYTDDCSVKCLNKVYGTEKAVVSTTSTNLNLLSGTLGKFMAETKASDADQCPQVRHTGTELWNVPDSQVAATIQAHDASEFAYYNSILEFFKSHSSGYFQRAAGGGVEFVSNYPNCYWAQYAPYYLTDERFPLTYRHDYHNGTHRPTFVPMTPASFTSGSNGGIGFEVAVTEQNCPGGICHSTCNDATTQASQSPQCTASCAANCHYEVPGGDLKTATQTTEDYDKTLASYLQALDECTAEAVCKSNGTPTTSTFYIGVNNDADKWNNTSDVTTEKPQPASGDGCPNSNNHGAAQIIQGRDSTTNNIVDGTGGLCYCGNDKYGDWHHYTRWTFPGSWVNIKTGAIRNTPPASGDEGFYNGGYNKYCVPESSDKNDEVNIAWHNEYLSNSKKYVEDSEARMNITYSDFGAIKWNIFARTQGFGNYGWKIDLRCFYSESIDSCTTDDSNCGGPDDPDPETSSSNTRIKVADPIDILPDAKDAGGKAIAFNWSDPATKLDVVDDDQTVYEIVPGAYREYVENVVGDDVFTDEYLDYEFELDGNKMMEINKVKLDYGIFDGDTVPIAAECKKMVSDDDTKSNCLNAYKSNLVRRFATVYPRNETALKCNNLDSSTSKNGAYGCATTLNGIIPSNDYLAWFRNCQINPDDASCKVNNEG